jgi:hypothetical protein
MLCQITFTNYGMNQFAYAIDILNFLWIFEVRNHFNEWMHSLNKNVWVSGVGEEDLN